MLEIKPYFSETVQKILDSNNIPYIQNGFGYIVKRNFYDYQIFKNLAITNMDTLMIVHAKPENRKFVKNI